MKKAIIILLISIFIFWSCSTSDESEDNSNDSSINPPEWIIGSWLLPEPNPTGGFRFSSNDFCLITLNTESCFKEAVDLTNDTGGTTNIRQDITGSSYSIQIELNSQVILYEFKSVSSSQIELVNDPLGDMVQTIYVKQ